MLDAKRVQDVMMDCLFTGDPKDEDMCIAVYGITRRFGFIPEKIENHREEIHEMMKELPDVFWDTNDNPNGGGGYTFMNLPFDKNERQWCGQPTAELLMVLGLATGYMEYMLPREAWIALPGRVPYVIIHENPVKVIPITVADSKKGMFSIDRYD